MNFHKAPAWTRRPNGTSWPGTSQKLPKSVHENSLLRETQGVHDMPIQTAHQAGKNRGDSTAQKV